MSTVRTLLFTTNAIKLQSLVPIKARTPSQNMFCATVTTVYMLPAKGYICMQINLYNLKILNIPKSLYNSLLHLEYLYNLDGTIPNILNTVHIDPLC